MPSLDYSQVNCSDVEWFIQNCEVNHDSTNATESDRPGAGRVLGKVFSRVGQTLEAFMNGLAERNGLGPSAVVERIETRRKRCRKRTFSLKEVHQIKYSEEGEKNQQRDLKRLIRYTKSMLHRLCAYTSTNDSSRFIGQE